MNNPNLILSKVYELHKAEIERLKENHTLELNAKLEQINKQAETIRELEKLRTMTLDRYLTNEQKRTRDQLLSALAAIEKHNNCEHLDKKVENISVDLSLLHKHDAKVRKSLMDALESELYKALLDETESVHGRYDQLARASGYRTGIEYALAKVKEKPNL